MRLDKFLADVGLGTRTEVKQLIKKKQITVNGQIATKPDTKIALDEDQIEYQNKLLYLKEFEYILLNKPGGYVSATKDNTAPTVLSLIHSTRSDLFPVGRLDKDTEGLLILSNDGDLAHRLLSPKHHVPKTYYAEIKGEVTQKDITQFANGIEIGDEDLEVTKPAKLSIVKPYDSNTDTSYIEVTITEGKFHQVKRMFLAIHKEVLYLKRISFGSLSLPNDILTGDYRALTDAEILILKKDANLL